MKCCTFIHNFIACGILFWYGSRWFDNFLFRLWHFQMAIKSCVPMCVYHEKQCVLKNAIPSMCWIPAFFSYQQFSLPITFALPLANRFNEIIVMVNEYLLPKHYQHRPFLLNCLIKHYKKTGISTYQLK